jgi:uncharacterized protein
MAEAVEMLVRASLLLADISRPRKVQPPARKTHRPRPPGTPAGRRPPPRR